MLKFSKCVVVCFKICKKKLTYGLFLRGGGYALYHNLTINFISYFQKFILFLCQKLLSLGKSIFKKIYLWLLFFKLWFHFQKMASICSYGLVKQLIQSGCKMCLGCRVPIKLTNKRYNFSNICKRLNVNHSFLLF